MKIDADELKKWIDRERKEYESMTEATQESFYAGNVLAYKETLKFINRMVKAEKKKQEGK